jgi:hypothetical protein
MRDWTRSKIVWVVNRGLTSAENRRYLRKGAYHLGWLTEPVAADATQLADL